MTDEELGKKMVEEESLYRFLDAYTHATGRALTMAHSCERPDFICIRDDGIPCGVELTGILDRELVQAYRMAFGPGSIPAADIATTIYERVVGKDSKRSRGNWAMAHDT